MVRAVELEGVERLIPLPTLELAAELFPGDAALQRAFARARTAAAVR